MIKAISDNKEIVLVGREKTEELIVHCTATTPSSEPTAKDINQWHKSLGWECIGYHWLVHRDGSIESGRPFDTVGAHCKGHNANSIGIAYVGGLNEKDEPEDTRTEAQKLSLEVLVKVMKYVYPSIKEVWGHNHYANKVCPCFDAHSELQPIIDNFKEQ